MGSRLRHLHRDWPDRDNPDEGRDLRLPDLRHLHLRDLRLRPVFAVIIMLTSPRTPRAVLVHRGAARPYGLRLRLLGVLRRGFRAQLYWPLHRFEHNVVVAAVVDPY